MCMERRSFLRSSAALVGAAALAPRDAAAGEIHPRHTHSAPLLVECANRLLASLDVNQKDRAAFPFDSDERTNWHFIPDNMQASGDRLGQRKGLPFRDMTPTQKHLASALLAAGLSRTGYVKAVTIMSLEEVLRAMGNDAQRRDPEKYYFSIFGTPSANGAWGYRVEGHHFSHNCTVVDGRVVDGPSFFGANPAEVRQGPRNGLRALRGEDDLGLELMTALDDQQRKIAIVDPTAYKEILTAASRKAALEGQPSGLSAARMNVRQFDRLMALMEEYARNVPDDVADARMAQIESARKEIHFAWSGGINRGDPRYYRVQSPSFLIEFDDTQDQANHIHSVWRDLAGDFGGDLLKQHYTASHAVQPTNL